MSDRDEATRRSIAQRFSNQISGLIHVIFSSQHIFAPRNSLFLARKTFPLRSSSNQVLCFQFLLSETNEIQYFVSLIFAFCVKQIQNNFCNNVPIIIIIDIRSDV